MNLATQYNNTYLNDKIDLEKDKDYRVRKKEVVTG
jgi:hypothetical protein